MADYDWESIVARVMEEECIDCDSSPGSTHHVAMPVSRPQYVDQALEDLAGPNEQHLLDPESHCDNPKCTYRIDETDPDLMYEINRTGAFTCPNCGHNNTLMDAEPFTPGGKTRAGLSLTEMGDIGEQIVFRMGEIPGVGQITKTWPSTQQTQELNGTVDCEVQGSRGTYGCEIKSNHSQAQERFKIGTKKKRDAKIAYCYQHGLKPALIGVRLNFYTNKAYIFFREGLTDTWIGNKQMIPVATVDFEDLNPFKSPDPQAQALAVTNAHLPDQSMDDDIDAAFGWNTAAKTASDDDFDAKHPRKEDGQFTFKNEVHEMKVVNKSGKHTHTAKHCRHCGHANFVPADHRGRVECSTCGEDTDRDLRSVSRVAAPADGADQVAAQLGFSMSGYTSNGHRRFVWEDPQGVAHTVISDSGGAHARGMNGINAAKARNRMLRCQNGQCMHGSSNVIPPVVEAKQPMFRAGQSVAYDGTEKFIMEIDGGLALVLDPKTGGEDVVPTTELQPADAIKPPSVQETVEQKQQAPFGIAAASSKKPDFMWVYYMGKLRVDEWHHNRQFTNLLEELLDEAGQDTGKVMFDLDPTDVAAGEIFEFSDGSIRVEHKQLAKEEIRERADTALSKWFSDKEDVMGEMSDEELPDRDPDTGQWVAE